LINLISMFSKQILLKRYFAKVFTIKFAFSRKNFSENQVFNPKKSH
jgi:hypothetical protein